MGAPSYAADMTEPFVTDRETLLRQYADGRSLDARANLYAWQQPRHDLVATVLSHVPADAEVILDVGCGRGQYLAALGSMQQTGFGLDLSEGLAGEATARTGMPTVVGDAHRLPVADDSVDATLALHVLNHLHEPSVALTECRRVTRSGGRVVVLTNSDEHIAEHRSLAGEAAGLDRAFDSTDRTIEEDLGLVRGVFDEVEVIHLDGIISIDRVGPLVDYAESAREFYERQVDGDWDEFIRAFAELATRRIERDGVIEITARTTVFVATVG